MKEKDYLAAQTIGLLYAAREALREAKVNLHSINPFYQCRIDAVFESLNYTDQEVRNMIEIDEGE